MAEGDDSKYSAPALEKGLDILELMASAERPYSQSEIAEALGRSQGEIYRMLASLERRGYLEREATTGLYRLTLRLYQIGHQQNMPAALRRAAQPELERLADELGQGCHISVAYGGSLLILLERLPLRRICLSIGEGTTLPLSQTSSGRILLSGMTDELRNQSLSLDPTYTSASASKRQDVHEQIEAAGRTGIVAARSEVTPGVFDIAVAIGELGTETAGVVALAFVDSDPTDSGRADDYLKAVMETARRIDQRRGLGALHEPTADR